MSILQNPIKLPFLQKNNPDLNDALKLTAKVLQRAANKPTIPITLKQKSQIPTPIPAVPITKGAGHKIFKGIEIKKIQGCSTCHL